MGFSGVISGFGFFRSAVGVKGVRLGWGVGWVARYFYGFCWGFICIILKLIGLKVVSFNYS